MDRRDFSLPINGLNLRVTEWGHPAAWPVVMLHGIRGYAETFAGLAEALQPDCRVIAFDQRGRGDSDWDPAHHYYTDAYVADLGAVVDALGLARFDLLGHSMGGINAIVYVGGDARRGAQHGPGRVRRLIIEDAGPGAFEASPGAARIRRELETTPTHFESWSAARDFMRQLRPTVTEEAREARLQNMLKSLPGGGFTWRYDHAGIAATRLRPDPARVVDLWRYVEAIECPTLVLRGGRSDYLQPDMAQAMVQRNSMLSWREIPDAGHYVHDDQPELVAEVVKAFLSEGFQHKG